MNSIIAGIISGTFATAPMTIAMETLFRQLPRNERYPLPPREITETLAEAVGVRSDLEERELFGLTLINHFLYGGLTGAVYGAVPKPGSGRGTVGSGVHFGLIVWTLSYLGWLPSARILKPATEHPFRRNALMIIAHIVWGGALGAFYSRFRNKSEITYRPSL